MMLAAFILELAAHEAAAKIVVVTPANWFLQIHVLGIDFSGLIYF